MAIWKRKKKEIVSEDNLQKEGALEMPGGGVSSVIAGEEATAKEQPVKQEELIHEKPPEDEGREPTEEYLLGGVVVCEKRISGFFGKGFWGVLSVLILPPVLAFALSILVVMFMLVFPLLAVILVALIPAVFVTLSILIIALPILFPLLILSLLITGKGRLLIASEGKWFGLEMFGKSYTLK